MNKEFEAAPSTRNANTNSSVEHDPGKIIFPVNQLERWQLEPGVSIGGLKSKDDVESVLEIIKAAMIAEQAPFLGDVSDKTKLNGPTVSHKMFLDLNQVARESEKIDVTGASVTVLEPNQMMLGNRKDRTTFALQDYLSIGIGIDQVVEFKTGKRVEVTRHYEIGMYISSARNNAKRKTNNSIFITGRHLETDKESRDAIKTARPKRSALSQSELEEKSWKKERERQDELDKRRGRRISRDIQFPDDWQRREQSLDFRNKHRINRPMQGGRFSGINKSKKRKRG